GVAILPFVILMVTLSPWSGGLVAKYGSKLPLVIGPTIAAIGFALFALTSSVANYWLSIFASFLVLGLGMAVTVAPLTTTVLESADEGHVGLASAINNAISRAGGLFAVAALSLIVIGVFGARLDASIAAMQVTPEARARISAQMAPQRTQLAAAQPPRDLSAPLRAELADDIIKSYVAGFRVAMLIAAGLALCSALIALFFIPARPGKTDVARPT
ncbi:MAG: MFS transporter, partial [Candidatus Eremiobacteraeota bacterium]|nr:MFS transporter [Candidatus Eremiobacteraeota bacterium]